jgi:hypothetical protein
MGLLSKIFSGIKKIVKGVAKVVKKVVKGVGKVVKKIARSKIFKAIAITAALIVTGGAAIGAFGGTMATSGFGTWMIGASQAITSVPFIGAIYKPFAALGTGIGKTAGATTDWLGITDKAARMGYKLDAATGTWVIDPSKEFKTGIKAAGDLSGKSLAEVTGSYPGTITDYGNLAKNQMVDPLTGKMIDIPSGQVWNPATNNVVNMTEAQLMERYPSIQAGKASVNASGQVIDTATGNVLDLSTQSKGGGWRNFASTVGTSVATNVATGYAMNELYEEDPTGQMAGLSLEGPSNLDPLAIYGSNGQPLSVADSYSSLMYGNADPFARQGSLYTQATIPA